MLPFVVAAQIAAASPARPDSTTDSTTAAMAAAMAASMAYSTPALEALVRGAVVANRAVPRALTSYRARVRSEMAVLLRQADGSESAGQIEEMENEVRWRWPGDYEQRVIGYRAQSAQPNIS